MTESTSSLMAILFGLGVFAVIVAIGWRSVQNRRILRLQGPNGQETIIVAGEDDRIDSIATSTETVETPPVETVVLEEAETADPAAEAEADLAGHERLDRVVASNK